VTLCCTDQQLGEVSPPHRHLFEAKVFRPPKLQHTVERRDSNGHLGRLPPFGPRAQRVTNHSLVAADIGFYQGTPIVTRCPLPAHATALGDQLQVPVALGRRGLCRGAWHRARTWRHNDRRIGMTLADLTVDIVPIVRSIAGKRHNRSRDLLKQGTDLRTVIDILAGQLGGDDLSRVGTRRDNVIAVGNSGTGKTHIALGLGLAACQKGLSVGFTTAAAMVHGLIEARDEKRLLRLQRQLAGYKLLIVDELGYVPLSMTGAELLFEVFSQRYERGSTIVTSNLPFDEWTGVFGSERLTGALLDRLTHHVHILELNGDSYRLKQSKRRQGQPQAAEPSDNKTPGLIPK